MNNTSEEITQFLSDYENSHQEAIKLDMELGGSVHSTQHSPFVEGGCSTPRLIRSSLRDLTDN